MICARCLKDVFWTIMSKFNGDIICEECEEVERNHPDFEYALEERRKALERGDFNFRGIGWPGKDGRAEKRRKGVRYEIPEKVKRNRPAICKGEGCLQEIYWIETEGGRRMPVDPDGTPHWATCPDAGRFKKGGAAK